MPRVEKAPSMRWLREWVIGSLLKRGLGFRRAGIEALVRGGDEHHGGQDQRGKQAEHAQGGEGAVDALAEGVGHGVVSWKNCALREEGGGSGLQGRPCGPSMALVDTPASFFDQITYC